MQKHAKLIEPQLITVDCNETDQHPAMRPTNHVNGRGDNVQLCRQGSGGGLRRFRGAPKKEVSVQENHRGYHVTTTVSKGGCGPAKVVLTSQHSHDNKAPVPPA